MGALDMVDLSNVTAWMHGRGFTETIVAPTVGSMGKEKPSHARDLLRPWIALPHDTPCNYNAE
jgi:hypothetical protein